MFDKFKIRVIIAVWEYHIAMYTWHMWHSIECSKKAWTLIGKMYCQ